MAKLTNPQIKLLTEAKKYTSVNCPVKYDILKSLCNIKSFDNTFNALYWRGYFAPVNTGDFSNQYILTKKASKVIL
jgi:hypothetical protein